MNNRNQARWSYFINLFNKINILFCRTILSFVIFNSIQCLVERSNSYSMGVCKLFFSSNREFGTPVVSPAKRYASSCFALAGSLDSKYFSCPPNSFAARPELLQSLGWEQFCHCIFKKKFFPWEKKTSFLRFGRISFVNAFSRVRTATDLKQGFMLCMGS